VRRRAELNKRFGAFATMARTAQDALQAYLRRVLLRSPLRAAERAAIVALPGEMVTIEVARDFVSFGERVDHACLIVDGLVARYAELRDGQRGIVAFHVPGDMADLHSVVAPRVTWALRAVTPSRILRIPHETLLRVAADFPAVALAFWRDCVIDANVLAQWTINLSRKEALACVAHLFCEMSVRYGLTGANGVDFFPFPITQATLADAIGLTPIHLNRVLKRLKDDGIAAKRADRVVVRDGPRLAAIGEFDPAYLQLQVSPAD
jgi:CRP-like cAMP-binding protein